MASTVLLLVEYFLNKIRVSYNINNDDATNVIYIRGGTGGAGGAGLPGGPFCICFPAGGAGGARGALTGTLPGCIGLTVPELLA